MLAFKKNKLIPVFVLHCIHWYIDYLTIFSYHIVVYFFLFFFTFNCFIVSLLTFVVLKKGLISNCFLKVI